MHEEHAGQLHQAPAHHSCWIHLRWLRVLDTTGDNEIFSNHNFKFHLFKDGTFSFEDFADTFEEYDVQRVMRSYENSISINVHCCEEGEWKQVASVET